MSALRQLSVDNQGRARWWWSNLQESYDLEISSIVFFEFHLVWAETGTHVFMNCLHIAILALSWKYPTKVPANWAYRRAINPRRSCPHADLIVATITWLFFLASCSNTYFGVDNDRLYRIFKVSSQSTWRCSLVQGKKNSKEEK